MVASLPFVVVIFWLFSFLPSHLRLQSHHLLSPSLFRLFPPSSSRSPIVVVSLRPIVVAVLFPPSPRLAPFVAVFPSRHRRFASSSPPFRPVAVGSVPRCFFSLII